MRLIKLILILSSLICASAYANTAFNYEENAINITEGLSVRSQNIENLAFVSLSYSQPSRLFRLDSRRNFEITYTPSMSEEYKQYAALSVGVSEDALLVQLGGFYAGLGLGAYVKDKVDDRINTRVMFGEKAFLGYRFSNPVAFELFAKNYNNMGLTDDNKSQNYAGLSFSVYY